MQSVDLRSTTGISVHQHCPVVAPHMKDFFVSWQIFWVPARMSCFCRVFDTKSLIVGRGRGVGSLGLICDGAGLLGLVVQDFGLGWFPMSRSLNSGIPRAHLSLNNNIFSWVPGTNFVGSWGSPRVLCFLVVMSSFSIVCPLTQMQWFEDI